MNRTTSLNAVLFDLDGTLIDTAVEFIIVVQAMREEYDLPLLNESRIRERVSDGSNEMVKLALEIEENHPKFADYTHRVVDQYREIAGSKCVPFRGILNFIRWLGKNKIKWGIATNKPRLYTNSILEKMTFNPFPDSVVCPEDITNPKPSPEALLLSCKLLKCNPNESVYIGDHSRDIEAGRRAGMYTIIANYGYISSTDDPNRWGANALAENALEFKNLLSSAFPYLKRL